jgi:hypothetical protein
MAFFPATLACLADLLLLFLLACFSGLHSTSADPHAAWIDDDRGFSV